jgi:hypothetical protein
MDQSCSAHLRSSTFAVAVGRDLLHRLPELQAWLGLNFDLTQFWTHLGVSLAALILPAIVPFAAYGLIRLFPQPLKPRPFIELAYGYLPLVLGGSLAYYLRLGLGEAGQILPVAWAAFGYSGEGLPLLVAHPAVITFAGSDTDFLRAFDSDINSKIARQPLQMLLPQHLGAIALGASLWSIIVGI